MSDAQGFHQQDYQRPELVCPAGTPAALRAAVDAGADAVYCGLQNETNARNFPGLNFTVPEVEQSLTYARARNAKLLLAVNTFPPAGMFDLSFLVVFIAIEVAHTAIGCSGRIFP
jgi:collagenase-like PrtC family protease